MNVASFCIYRRFTLEYVSNAHFGLKDSAVHSFHSGLPDYDVCTIPISNVLYHFAKKRVLKMQSLTARGMGVSQNCFEA